MFETSGTPQIHVPCPVQTVSKVCRRPVPIYIYVYNITRPPRPEGASFKRAQYITQQSVTIHVFKNNRYNDRGLIFLELLHQRSRPHELIRSYMLFFLFFFSLKLCSFTISILYVGIYYMIILCTRSDRSGREVCVWSHGDSVYFFALLSTHFSGTEYKFAEPKVLCSILFFFLDRKSDAEGFFFIHQLYSFI